MTGCIFALEFRFFSWFWWGMSFLEAQVSREVCRPPGVQLTAGVVYAVSSPLFSSSQVSQHALRVCKASGKRNDQN